MFAHKVIKPVPVRVNRSGFHHLVISGFHVNRRMTAERDILGAVLVVILTAVVAFLARIVLAN
jgi:hypothetical protein